MPEEQKEEEVILDIRQKKTWDFYINPKSETYGNARASAIKAGYTDLTANTVTLKEWFKKKLRRINLLSKAEKVLNKTLDMETMGDNGKEQADLLRVQNDAAKFVAKTLGKDEGYSERTEVTGKDGSDIVFMPVELLEKYGLGEKKEVEEETKGL